MSGRLGYIAVYIMSDGVRGTLYIGMTGDLARRVWEHREKVRPGFTKTYGLDRLVWYEPQETLDAAYQRERSLKRYYREWKINLVERENPYWVDLYPTLNL